MVSVDRKRKGRASVTVNNVFNDLAWTSLGIVLPCLRALLRSKTECRVSFPKGTSTITSWSHRAAQIPSSVQRTVRQPCCWATRDIRKNPMGLPPTAAQRNTFIAGPTSSRANRSAIVPPKLAIVTLAKAPDSSLSIKKIGRLFTKAVKPRKTRKMP